MTKEQIKEPLKTSIDANMGALILIDFLYIQKLINKETYKNIQEKYKLKNKHIKAVER